MDSYKTPLGELQIEVFGHASLLFKINGMNIYIDPYSEVCSFEGKPKADAFLITHNHYDHYDINAIAPIEKDDSKFIVGPNVGKIDERYIVLNNGDGITWNWIDVTAVPSYNINRRNEEGNHFHPKGVGNGYIIDIQGFRIYVAGDTEPIPEMSEIKDIDIAFIPKNLPYTMTDEEFISCANQIKPKYLYPYHYFTLDVEELRKGVDPEIKILDR